MNILTQNRLNNFQISLKKIIGIHGTKGKKKLSLPLKIITRMWSLPCLSVSLWGCSLQGRHLKLCSLRHKKAIQCGSRGLAVSALTCVPQLSRCPISSTDHTLVEGSTSKQTSLLLARPALTWCRRHAPSGSLLWSEGSVCARSKLEQGQQDAPLWSKLRPSAKLGGNRTYQPKRSWVFRWELAVEGKNLSGLTEDTSFCFISLPNFSYISLNQQDNHSAAFRIVLGDPARGTGHLLLSPASLTWERHPGPTSFLSLVCPIIKPPSPLLLS